MSRVGNLEEADIEHQVFSLQAKKSARIFTGSFNFEKHVNINSVHLTKDQPDAVKVCAKCTRKIFRKTPTIEDLIFK